jgi:hypothetical protein
MKSAPAPVILFLPALSDKRARELLELLQTLTHTVELYYANQLRRTPARPTLAQPWDDDDLPF